MTQRTLPTNPDILVYTDSSMAFSISDVFQFPSDLWLVSHMWHISFTGLMLDRLYAVKRPIDYRKKSIDGKVWEKDKNIQLLINICYLFYLTNNPWFHQYLFAGLQSNSRFLGFHSRSRNPPLVSMNFPFTCFIEIWYWQPLVCYM